MVLTHLCLSMWSFLRTFQNDWCSILVTARSLAIASDWYVSTNNHKPRGSRTSFSDFGDLWLTLQLFENHLRVDWKFKLCVTFRNLLQQVVVWLHVVGACCNECHIHYISCDFQIICSKKCVISFLRFILSNMCFSELHVSAEMPLKIS
jgi:CDP-diglyceride synthetase